MRLVAGAFALLLATAAPAAPIVTERSIDDLAAMLRDGRTTSRALVKAYRARIAAIDASGPALHSVIAVDPTALAQAEQLDRERKNGRVRGPLHGVPILIKDNIEAAGPLPTTAGSLALKDNVTNRDAPLVARLRAAGAIILGKTNLSEWANIRSTRSTSGWSAIGGLVRNPYALDRNACGSSSGSGAAAAASLAAATIGTETDGSITCPAAVNGVVGMKPTVGLVSRTHVVPISHSQDTAGPMTRSVRDAAILLTALAGSDPADPATAEADSRRTDYTAKLVPKALRGKRVGVLRFAIGPDAKVAASFERALADLQRAGATLVDIADLPHRGTMREAEGIVLSTELKADLEAYLATTPPSVTQRTLDDLITFNREHAALELRWFGQERFESAAKTGGLADLTYRQAAATARRLAGPEGIDRLLAQYRVDLLVAPSQGAAWTTDLINGDRLSGIGAGSMAAIAGYPHITVPMGLVEGLPVGLSMLGPAWSDGDLLGYAFAFEQVAIRRRPPTYSRTLPRMLSH